VWSQIFCGYNTTYAIQSNGTLWAWGQGGQGQLGNLSTTNISSPVQIGTVSIWAKINGTAIAGQYAIGLQSNGTLWSWGAGNNFFALGQGNSTSYSTPIQIGSISTWSNIATGSFFTLALRSNGTLWAWGQNNNGRLGLGDQTVRSVPTQVGALSTWTQIACGYNYSLAIQTPGTLWAWGQNNNGQLGLNTTVDVSSPVQVGVLNYWTQVSSNARNNVLVIQTPGTLWAWGNNSFGQLGLTPLGISVTKVTYGL
jgi:alpha-tubulin suppressor-like RCC1 family protein